MPVLKMSAIPWRSQWPGEWLTAGGTNVGDDRNFFIDSEGVEGTLEKQMARQDLSVIWTHNSMMLPST